MKIEIHLIDQSQPVTRYQVRNSYEKGSMFCIMFDDMKVEKYPIRNIFRVVEYDKNYDDYTAVSEADYNYDVEAEPCETVNPDWIDTEAKEQAVPEKKSPFKNIDEWREWMDQFYGKAPYTQTFNMNPKFEYDWVMRENEPKVTVVEGLGITNNYEDYHMYDNDTPFCQMHGRLYMMSPSNTCAKCV